MAILFPLIVALGWKEFILVLENTSYTEEHLIVQDLSAYDVTYAMVSGMEAMHGEFLRHFVKAGTESWRPLHFVLVCSIECFKSVFFKADQLEKSLATSSAFSMSSRWLLIPTDLQLGGKRFESPFETCMLHVAVISTSIPASSSAVPKYLVHTLRQGPGTVFFDYVGQVGAAGRWKSELEIFPNIKYGFNRRKLLLMTKEWTNFVQVRRDNGTKVWDGLMFDMLQMMSETLNFTTSLVSHLEEYTGVVKVFSFHNNKPDVLLSFNTSAVGNFLLKEYDIVEPEDRLWVTGTKEDNTSGFFGHIIRKEADVGFTSVDLIWERSAFMDFSSPFIFSSNVMVYRRSVVSMSIWHTFLGTFDNWVLIAVVTALTFVSGLIFASEIIMMPSRRNLWLSALEGAVDATISTILVQSSAVMLRSRSSRLLFVCWCFFTVVLAAAYSSTLTAVLSVSKGGVLFSSLSDLTRQSAYEWGSIPHASIDIILQNSNNSVYRQIWEGLQEFHAKYPEIEDSGLMFLAKSVKMGNVVGFVNEFDLTVFNDTCNIVTAPILSHEGAGVVFPKQSALVKPFSEIILQLQVSGHIDKWKAKWFPKTACQSTTGPPVSITINHVTGALLTLPVGLGLALLVLVCEVFYRHKQHPNPSHDLNSNSLTLDL